MAHVPDRPPATRDLQQCPDCRRPFVEPDALLGVCDDGVVVVLRCGNCGWREALIAHTDAFEQLDRDLDAATSSMLADRRALELDGTASEFDTFIAALHADAVLPEDFQT